MEDYTKNLEKEIEKMQKEIKELKAKIKLVEKEYTWLGPQPNVVRAFAMQSINNGDYYIAAFIDLLTGATFSNNVPVQTGSDLQFTLTSKGTTEPYITFATSFFDAGGGNPQITTISVKYPDGTISRSSTSPGAQGTLAYPNSPIKDLTFVI